ncbi:MAG: FMN-binding protein [Eubacterium sp.]|nr:FMN-binding protein [Eubacterium sp.]
MIDFQTADVDIVSSATLTSNGIIEGVKKALKDSEHAN